MFARVAIRSAMRAPTVRPVAAAAATGFKVGATKVALSTSASRKTPPEVIQERHVPVTHWEGGVAAHEVLNVSDKDQPVNPAQQDEEVVAKPLDPEVTAKLTPTMSKFTLHGKVAVVTGGGRGLGYNMAQALAEVGIKGIAIMDVQQELGEKSAQQLSEQTGVDVRFYKVDVRDGHAINQAVQDAVDHYGHIDVLISAAGIADSNIKAENYDSEKFRRLLDINITGSFLVAQSVGRHMIHTKNGGSIIFIASMSGSIVNYPQEQSCYNASKAAVVQMTKSLAAEWARHKIRVNAISPGYMDTALNRVPALEAQKRIWVDNTPQKRLGAVDDLNCLAVYLSSPASSYMTGNNCLIDGGYTLW
ncbi:NADP-dependent mannitol dehydrogenase-like protein 1 [Elsinoe australis]|uniref:NADP-dependent mannitol dehydrogenase n=1 Tax=Elsinoe australis TaxID=40998 RepID=A0A4U7B151_9PEZI|nr:NADP-dependent mannitol dehydrogenase-like protein 1 [Elsinoe australis]